MSLRRFDPARPLLVEADGARRPRLFVWRGRVTRVIAVEATWDEATGWWREPDGATARRCYRVRTASGLRCLLYHALADDGWSLGAILD